MIWKNFESILRKFRNDITNSIRYTEQTKYILYKSYLPIIDRKCRINRKITRYRSYPLMRFMCQVITISIRLPRSDYTTCNTGSIVLLSSFLFESLMYFASVCFIYRVAHFFVNFLYLYSSFPSCLLH